MATEMRYADVQAFLKKLAGNRHPGHDGKGSFWTKAYEEFIALKIYNETLIVLQDPEASALIKALRGVPPFDDAGPYGGRMPLDGPYATDEEIAPIALWIRKGCPK